ncbi:MAG: hypothetical protein KGH54_04075 [Candidatus Micrarchaeota archaeon]|nr:hypothetical protein [Candidatus Micrarchaeota archaeon]
MGEENGKYGKQLGREKEKALGEIVRDAELGLSCPERICINVMLAGALEPIADKKGCTTRYVDLKPSKSLELFVAAGVSSGPAFAHLAQHVIVSGKAQGAYRYFHEAQALSKIKRSGGKVNQGIIELLTPIVAAQALFDPTFRRDYRFILNKAREVMILTSKEDVRWLIETKKLANRLSCFDRYPVAEHEVESVIDYYEEELRLESARGNLKGMQFNMQFLEGFEGVRIAYDAMAASKKQKISEKGVEAYEALHWRYTCEEMGVGTFADIIAATLYLYISYGKGEVIL